MPVLPDIHQEMRRIIAAAQAQGLILRAFGGLAIKIHCPSTDLPALKRESADIDLIAGGKQAPRLAPFFVGLGYLPDSSLNLLNGDTRQLYFDPIHNRQVDVLVGDFEMCHKINLDHRLTVEDCTIPLAELFLTKAQIVLINGKDLRDMAALLLDHPLGVTDTGAINTQVICEICSRDWGFYTTIVDNLRRLQDYAQQLALLPEQIAHIQQRASALLNSIEETPKNQSWKLRAKLGRRVRWYAEVEEVVR